MSVRPPRAVATITLALILSGCASSSSPSRLDPTADAIEQSTRSTAMGAEASSDYQTAAINWRSLLERHPNDPDIAFHMARSLRYAGQIQAAVDLLNSVIDKSGRSPQLLTELGKCYLAGDRLGLAIRTLTEAAERAPNDWQVQSALGVAQDYQGNYPEAQAAYNRALLLSPDNPVVLNNLGLSQAQNGHLLEALATLEKAADQPKAGAQVRQNLALIKALTGDVNGAERLNRQDLPPDAVRANGTYYKSLGGRID